jgi:uncharacterized phage-associated protein
MVGKGRAMANINDVAAAIISKTGTVSAMKLEKLAYYSQAWSLVWDESPLFVERVEAWAGGPVIPALYHQHKGMFLIEGWKGDPSALSKSQLETIDSVISYYGGMTAQGLSDLTHSETPWIEARKGLAPLERGNSEITHAAMAEYYAGL